MNTGKETLSPFIDNSIDNVIHAYFSKQDRLNLLTFFSFISTCIMLGLISTGSAKADVG